MQKSGTYGMQPIILAAGKGSRMRSVLPKTLFQVEGKAMLDHILEASGAVSELSQPIIVVGYGADDIKSHLREGYTLATQPELNGTGGAVKATLPHLPESGYVFVLYGDQPFMRPETLEAMVKLCEEEQPTLVQSTVELPDFEEWRSVFTSYGRIIRTGMGTIKR
jgi:bifunctional UDP-N-acetylglucosamine pyrophosphorylase/glucosamine-1-phosphate N-acetyltransferase